MSRSDRWPSSSSGGNETGDAAAQAARRTPANTLAVREVSAVLIGRYLKTPKNFSRPDFSRLETASSSPASSQTPWQWEHLSTLIFL